MGVEANRREAEEATSADDRPTGPPVRENNDDEHTPQQPPQSGALVIHSDVETDAEATMEDPNYLKPAPDVSDDSASVRVHVVDIPYIRDEILDLIEKHQERDLQQKVMQFFKNDVPAFGSKSTPLEQDTQQAPMDVEGQTNGQQEQLALTDPQTATENRPDENTPQSTGLFARIMQLPSPNLRRSQQNRAPTSAPGAYPRAPSGVTEQTETGHQHGANATVQQDQPNAAAATSLEGNAPEPGLAIAREVSGEEVARDRNNTGEPIVMAEPLGFLGKWQKPILALAGLSILAAIAVGITCGATDVCSAGGNIIEVNVTQAPTPPPTQSPTLAPTANVIGGLPASTIEALLDPESPQALAYQWIMNDPNRLDYSYNRLVQRFALATLIYGMGAGTDHNQTADWLSYDVHECLWWNDNATKIQQLYAKYPGQPCSEDGQYQYLVPLEVDLLSGQIPPELGLLTSLLILDLTQQDTSGTLPPELGRLSNMHKLAIPQATGTIPTEFGSMSSLEIFSMVRCGLSGQIPTEIGRLSALRVLDLAGNFMDGSIPSQIGLLGSLEMFSLLDNGGTLNSTIPTQVGGLSSLRIFNVALTNPLQQGGIIGPIPTQFGALTKMEEFYLRWNLLTSTLPSEFGLLPRLRFLDLEENNRMLGTIPTEIGMISALEEFWAGDNNMFGPLPSELGLLANLTKLQTPSCQLSEALPSELGLLKKLEEFNMRSNHFTGTIPTEFGNMDSLWFINLMQTSVEGPIPSEFGVMKSLGDIEFYRSLFSGTIPSELGLSTTIYRFAIFDNAFTGTIPTELGRLWPLNITWDLNFESNLISGTIPTELSRFVNTKHIVGRANQLTGPIPSEFGLLTGVYEIKFGSNQLSGVIPTEILSLKAAKEVDGTLHKFDVSNNLNLTGRYAGDICEIEQLIFDCSKDMCGCWCICPEEVP